ncbi:hypothetical protein FS749_011295 [Ceratobasidium sp. UAMH 11750]|nr:hypothetical protein FS749_011295 [Ceratobasidium sp. UAMH 11750]
MAGSKRRASRSPERDTNSTDTPSSYTLSADEKVWLNDHYATFKSKLAHRGTTQKENAKGWVFGELVQVFMSQHDSNASLKSKIGRAVYVYYKDRKVRAKDLWAKDNKEAIDNAIAEDVNPNESDEIPLNKFHRVSWDLYNALQPDERTLWEQRAEEECRLASAASAAPLTGKAKQEYEGKFLTRVNMLLKEGERKAGIYCCVYVAIEKAKESDEGNVEEDDDIMGEAAEVEEKAQDTYMQINSLHSPGIGAIKHSDAYKDGSVGFGEFLRENLGKIIMPKSPGPAIIPDKKGYPLVPAGYKDFALGEKRDLARTALNAHWQIGGGQGSVPWTWIENETHGTLHDWVEKSSMPKARLADPSKFNMAECDTWLEWLSDPTHKFQFRQVYASKNHVFPDPSVIASRDTVRRGNISVVLVKFSGRYDKPQTTSPIKYLAPSYKYMHYLREMTIQNPSPAIDKGETDTYLGWLKELEDDEPDVYGLVRALITSANRLERFAPTKATTEIWLDDNNKPRRVPFALPQSPPSDTDCSTFKTTFWTHRCYYGLLTGGPIESTTAFIGGWLDSQRTGPLYDADTKTYRAGKEGFAWIIRLLIKMTANVAAAVGKIEPPVEAPEGYDLARMGTADWKACLRWMKEWQELIDKAAQLAALTAPRLPPAVSRSDLAARAPPENETTQANSVTTKKTRSRKAKGDAVASASGLDDTDVDNTQPDSGANAEAKQGAPGRKKRRTAAPKDLLGVPTRPSIDFNDRVSLFGSLPKLLAVAPFDGSPQQLSDEIRSFFDDSEGVFSRHNKAHEQYADLYDIDMLDQARTRVGSIDADVKPLLQVVLKHRGMWLKAESVWSEAASIFGDFRRLHKSGARLIQAIMKIQKARSGPATKTLSQQLPKVKAYTRAHKCLIKEFKMYESLSVQWANHLHDQWESIPLTATAAELTPLVVAIWDWHNDYRNVKQNRRAERKEIWNRYRTTDYIPALKACWYIFGCPTDEALDHVAEVRVQAIPRAKSFINWEDEDEESGDNGEYFSMPNYS